MPEFQVRGKIFRSSGKFLREANFNLCAASLEEAKFCFRHGVQLTALPHGFYARVDLRTLKRKREGKETKN